MNDAASEQRAAESESQLDNIVKRAHILSERGRHDEATAVLGSVLAEIPDHPTLWQELCLLHLAAGKGTLALQAARRAVELAPDDPRSHIIVSVALSRVGRHKEAVHAAREAVRIAPHLPHTHCQLAQSLRKYTGFSREGSNAIKQAIELAPDEPHLYLVASLHAMSGKKWKDVAAFSEKALRLDPTNSSAMRILAEYQEATGRTSKAAATFAAAAAADPRSEFPRLALSRLLGQLVWRAIATCFITYMFFVGWATRWPWLGQFATAIAVVLITIIPVVWSIKRLPPSSQQYLRSIPRTRPLLAGAIGMLLLACLSLLVATLLLAVQPDSLTGNEPRVATYLVFVPLFFFVASFALLRRDSPQNEPPFGILNGLRMRMAAFFDRWESQNHKDDKPPIKSEPQGGIFGRWIKSRGK